MPTIGEMFSGNDIEMSNPTNEAKIFVDVNTIENPEVASWYWTMNRYDSTGVRIVYFSGYTHYFNSLSSPLGVRPVIYLKSGLEALDFIGGNGTAQSPYVLQ